MRFDDDEIVSWENVNYRLGEYEDEHALYFKAVGESWLPRFSFTRRPRQLEEYADVCHMLQTSPESHFTHKRVVTIALIDGRVILADRKLEIRQAGKIEVRSLQSNQEYKETLQTYFNIQLSSLPESW
jgi:N-hydroxyarylamine O-acetyltransferase